MASGMVPNSNPQVPPLGTAPKNDVIMDCDIKELYYGTFKAVRDTKIPIKKNAITAFIGPSGCGKSTVLRCLNRMNDLVRGFRFNGQVRYRGKDIYDPAIDPVAVRRYIGMVFGIVGSQLFSSARPLAAEMVGSAFKITHTNQRPDCIRLLGSKGATLISAFSPN